MKKLSPRSYFFFTGLLLTLQVLITKNLGPDAFKIAEQIFIAGFVIMVCITLYTLIAVFSKTATWLEFFIYFVIILIIIISVIAIYTMSWNNGPVHH
jgi:hypothetical protein